MEMTLDSEDLKVTSNNSKSVQDDILLEDALISVSGETLQDAEKVDSVDSVNYILSFKAIHSFIAALNEEFGKKNKALKLYGRLIEQTTFSHEFAIKKHVKCFMEWCIKNREEIYAKKYQQLRGNVSYSDKVFLNIKDLFKIADTEQRNVMWQHILTISALVDSTGRAKQILKQNYQDSNESNFLTDIIEKVEGSIDPTNPNPMDAIGKIMSSGVFTNLVSSMNEQVNSGELDITKMLSVVQSMVGTVSKEQPEMSGLLSGLMGSINLPTTQ